MTVTANSSLTAGIGTASTTVQKALPSVPANATIVLGILNRSDETTAIDSISDDINGTWTLNYVSGPYDSTNTTFRSWLAYRNNCSSGTTTITVTFGAAINSQLAVGYLSSDAGAMTFDAAATVSETALAQTNADSNNAAASGAGAIIGFASMNNSQADPEPTADGTGESRITSGQSGGRAFLFFETYAAGGNYGVETTTDSACTVIHVGAFLEAGGGGSTYKRRRGMMMGVG